MSNDKGAGPAVTETDWTERLDLPRLKKRNALLAMSPHGSSLAIAEGSELYLFGINNSAARWEAEPIWRQVTPGTLSSLTVSRGGACVFAYAKDDETHVAIADTRGTREIASFPAGVTAICVADDCIAVALSATKAAPPRICIVNLRTGEIVRTIHVPGIRIDLCAAAGGRRVLITDKHCGRSWIIDPKGCATLDDVPSAPGSIAVDAPDGGIVAGTPGGSLTRYPQPGTPAPGDDQSTPAPEPDCRVRIDFDLSRLIRSGEYLTAIAAGGRQFAILDGRTLEIVNARRFGRFGAAIVGDATGRALLSYDRARNVWERFDIAEAIAGLARWRDRIDETDAPDDSETDEGEVVFVGRTSAPLLDGRVPPRGTTRMLVLPLLEAGQSFGASDIAPLHNFLTEEIFPVLTNYYEEVSYRARSPEEGVTITFDTLGVEFRPGDAPLRLPDTYENYFFGDHEAGGFKTTITNAVTPLELILEGSETLGLRATHPDFTSPGGLVLNLRFAAMSTTGVFAGASTTLAFDGGEELQLTLRASPGSAPVVQSVRFTPESFEIRATDPEPELRRLQAYLDTIFSAAATPDLRLMPRVRRVATGVGGFGELHVDFAFPGAPRATRHIEESGLLNDRLGTLAAIGFGNAATGRYRFAHAVFRDDVQLEAAFTRALLHAEIDAGLAAAGATIFQPVRVSVVSTDLRIQFELDGFVSGRSLALESQNGLEVFGFDTAIMIFDRLEARRPIDNERLPRIRFRGTETARVAARASRGSAPLTLTVPFETAHGTGFTSSLPTSIDFSDASVNLFLSNSDGTNRSVMLDFPAGSRFEIAPASVRDDLQTIEDFVNDRLAAVDPMNAVRIKLRYLPDSRGSLNFFSFASYRMPDDMNRSISSSTIDFGGGGQFTIGLDALQSLNDPIDGGPDDRDKIAERLRLALASASYDAGRPVGTSVFKTPSVTRDAETNEITILWSLADDFGEGGASAEVLDWDPLLIQLGFDNVDSIVGGAAGFDARNTVRRFTRGGSSPGDSGAPIFGDDIVTALLDRVEGFDNKTDLANEIERNFEAVMLLIVGPAPTEVDGRPVPPEQQWTASPLTHERYREFASLETTLRHNSGFVMHQITRTWFLGSVFESSAQSITDHIETMVHEIGHVYGFYDLYSSVRHRADLDYLERWSVMSSAEGLSHVDAFHKREIGWLPEDPLPTARPGGERSMVVDEAILIAHERWDPALVPAARAAFAEAEETDVMPLMELLLDSAGRQSVLVEARQAGVLFSGELPDGPGAGTEGRILVTNAVDPDDLLREVSRDLGYRRHLHLLKVLEDGDPEFDLGSLDKLAVGGTRIRIDGRAEIPTADGPVVAFKIGVERDPAPFVELGFFDPLPNYLSTDVWIDWPGPDATIETADPQVFPVGQPEDQFDTIMFPPDSPEGLTEPHFIVARIRNAGDIRVEQVEVRFLVCQPAGSGDRGNFVEVDSQSVSVVPPLTESPDGVAVAGRWNVPPDAQRHTCVRAEIVDWRLPERAPGDPGAIDDLTPDDNSAQKNINRFELLSASPFEPLEFDYSVANDGPYVEHARLQTQGLPAGWRVTVNPAGRTLAPGEIGLFHCMVEADAEIVEANCTADVRFDLVARRNAHVNEVPWGTVKYIMAPRKRVAITVRGGWSYGPLWFTGEIAPIPLRDSAIARISFDGGERVWKPLSLRNGRFEFRDEFPPPAGTPGMARITVFYNGDDVFGASESEEVSFPFVTLI